jgi:hypothetical protein
MPRPAVEVADVFRALGQEYWERHAPHVSREQQRVVRAITSCRTAALGGHVEACDACAYQRIAYNSCRDRHCPKCQGAARDLWVAARREDLLEVEYFHLVFTLPDEIARIALRNKRCVYGCLFRAAWETLRSIASDPKHLGAEVGMVAVLHTWGQTLTHHPHLHCVVPGGGLSPEGGWVRCRRGFLLPVRVLSSRFRSVMLAELERAAERGEIAWVGQIEELADPEAFGRLVRELRATKWVVYAKRPFGGPEQVLKYLGRYTHKVAITNHRLLALEGGVVHFRYRDYRADAERVMTLSVEEFARRFLQHVLPDGFQRIRHYGLLANRGRREKLARCRASIGPGLGSDPSSAGEVDEAGRARTASEREGRTCPTCGKGLMRRVRVLEPADLGRAAPLDTS